MIRVIAQQTLRSPLQLPSTWFALAILQFIFAWFYLSNLDVFLSKQAQTNLLANPPGATMMVSAPVFNVLALLCMMIIPLFTMRSISEERRYGSFALLRSAPISNLDIVLGKFTGLGLFFTLFFLLIFAMLYSLNIGTAIDHGLMLSNLIGILLLSSCYIALGLYCSSLTKQPIIAAISTMAILLGLWLADTSAAENTPWPALSPLHHFQSFNAGSLSSYDTMYFVCVTLLCLGLTTHRLKQLE